MEVTRSYGRGENPSYGGTSDARRACKDPTYAGEDPTGERAMTGMRARILPMEVTILRGNERRQAGVQGSYLWRTGSYGGGNAGGALAPWNGCRSRRGGAGLASVVRSAERGAFLPQGRGFRSNSFDGGGVRCGRGGPQAWDDGVGPWEAGAALGAASAAEVGALKGARWCSPRGAGSLESDHQPGSCVARCAELVGAWTGGQGVGVCV